MAVSYATGADLLDSEFLPEALVGEVPADPSRLLARASRVIDRALLAAVYDVDTDGAPTDTKVAAALRDATCAQACWWLETGDEAGAAASVTAASSTGPSWSGTVPRLAPDAVTVLSAAVDEGGNPLLSGPWTS